METAIYQLLLTAFTAVVSSLVTVWFSLRRFYREKWWERRMTTYAEIIESLHHMKLYLDEHLEAEMNNRKLPEERKAELLARDKAAYANILKSADVGEFLISRSAVGELKELKKALDQAGQSTRMYFDHLDESYGAVAGCLDRVKVIAREDLRLASPLWGSMKRLGNSLRGLIGRCFKRADGAPA